MIISKLIAKGQLENRESSDREIDDLLKIVTRDFNDSFATEISSDWQFGIAYNAALKLATILIRKSGYRIRGQGHHYLSFLLIPEILGQEKKIYAEYLEVCRQKRNKVEYDCVDGATDSDVQELQEFVRDFHLEVLDWLNNF
ncbi:MAG: hypothetical protein GY909_00690 [Oligoflexia bacterium]|nr:hypothetical protein [Oligoflexia bacterium]